MNIRRINPGKRWSDVAIYNGIANFVEIAEATPSGDMASQIRQILQQTEQKLAQIGSDRASILTATIYITDFKNLPALNAVWDAWFPEGSAPSRCCVKVELADPELLVEIAFSAAVGIEKS